MLKPSMNELMAKVNNRYLLVNLAAQRARDLADESETTGVKLTDKAVKLALDEIADGTIVYRDGPRTIPEPEPEPLPEVLDLDAEAPEPEPEAPADETEASVEGAKVLPFPEGSASQDGPLTEGF